MPAILLLILFIFAIASGLWKLAMIPVLIFGLFIYFVILTFKPDPKRPKNNL